MAYCRLLRSIFLFTCVAFVLRFGLRLENWKLNNESTCFGSCFQPGRSCVRGDESNKGEEYFSYDSLQQAWNDRFCARRDNKVVSRKAAKLNASRNNATLKETISKLLSMGITVDDYAPAFTEEELDIYFDAIKKGW